MNSGRGWRSDPWGKRHGGFALLDPVKRPILVRTMLARHRARLEPLQVRSRGRPCPTGEAGRSPGRPCRAMVCSRPSNSAGKRALEGASSSSSGYLIRPVGRPTGERVENEEERPSTAGRENTTPPHKGRDRREEGMANAAFAEPD